MRFAFLLPAALLATSCGVPDVTFAPGGGVHDAGKDVGVPADGGDAAVQAEAGDDGPILEGASDAPPSDFCKGDAGPPPGYTNCCGGGAGVVCGKMSCGPQACLACTTTCAWPNVCCPSGNMGKCQAPPCP